MKISDSIFLLLVVGAMMLCVMLPSVFSLGEGCNSSPDNCTTLCEFCNATTAVCEISPNTMDNKSECPAFVCNANYLYTNYTGLCNGTTAVCDVVTDTYQWNVTIGQVCVNETDYDVAPTPAVFCNDTWVSYLDGACEYGYYYVGYRGDNTTTCNETGWVFRVGGVDVLLDYIINTTISAPENNSYVTNTGEVVPAKNACFNAYRQMGPSGYCDGAGALDTNDAISNVGAGKVCINSTNTSVAPTSAVKCSSWYECVADAATASIYYVGYAGDGTATCVVTGWVDSAADYTFPSGRTVRTTANSSVCVLKGYGYSYAKSDFQNIVVDGLGTTGASFVDVAELIVIALVLLVLAGLIVKIKKH